MSTELLLRLGIESGRCEDEFLENFIRLALLNEGLDVKLEIEVVCHVLSMICEGTLDEDVLHLLSRNALLGALRGLGGTLSSHSVGSQIFNSSREDLVGLDDGGIVVFDDVVLVNVAAFANTKALLALAVFLDVVVQCNATVCTTFTDCGGCLDRGSLAVLAMAASLMISVVVVVVVAVFIVVVS